MTKKEFASYIDHTLLNTEAGVKDIIKLCQEAVSYEFASVCVNPVYVPLAASELENTNVKVCTVVGFPLGASTTVDKVHETKTAIKNGADEIDMVINIGDLKSKKYDEILTEINKIKEACGEKILKVIVETCLLTNEEKIKMCEIVSKSNADYIKTSTGFGAGGATIEDIKIFKSNIKNGKGIKAAGGISSFEDAEEYIKSGATRLGTSKLVKLIKE